MHSIQAHRLMTPTANYIRLRAAPTSKRDPPDVDSTPRGVLPGWWTQGIWPARGWKGAMLVNRNAGLSSCVRPLLDALYSRSAIGLLLCAAAVSTEAQTPKYGVHEKAIERVNEARDIGPLKIDGMFGDNLSMYNGSVDFAVTDVSIPGNSGLPVEVRRRFNVVDRRETASVTWFDHFGGFAEWDLDIPHLSGTFAASTGWQVSGSSPNQRCSTTNAPPALTYFPAYHYWNGYRLNTPGQGDRPLLVRTAGSPIPTPSDGASYPWVTKDFWTIKCKSSTKNSYAGEAFIAVSPNGTRYHLDHVITKSNSSSKSYAGNTEVSIARVSVYFVATRVEDRFGNWVDYTWSGDKLQSITANDGRQITLAYDTSGRIASAAAPTGTWSYAYLNGRLRTVTRPDASQWIYQAEGKLNLAGADPLPMDNPINNCPENFDGVGGAFIYTVTHPSGASARFEFPGMRHHRSNTPKHCVKPNNQYEYLQIPNYSDNFTLTKKTITGPGLAPMVWSYTYGTGAADSYEADCVFGIDELCPATKQQVVTGPDGSWERYEYGIMYGLNEGQLLKKEAGTGPAGILQTEIYNYLADSVASSQNFPNMVGADPRSFTDILSSAKLRPMVTRTIQRQGIDFNWGVNACSGKYCFDVFSNPTSVTKSSTLPGTPSKVVQTEYEHNYTYWVLGQIKKTTEGGTVASETTYNLMALPEVMKSFGKVKQTLGYYTDGTVATVKDGNNNTITLSNWYRGIPRSIAYPNSSTQSATVSTAGWVTAVTDQNGYVTGYGYDAMGRLASVVYPTGDTTAWNTTTQVFQQIASSEYGVPAGHWRQTISTGNARKITYFDGLWRPLVTREYDVANETGTKRFQRFTYDHAGRTTFASYPGTTDALSTGNWNQYDSLGRPISSSQDSELGVLSTVILYETGFKTRVTNPRTISTLTSYRAWDTPTTDYPIQILHANTAITDIGRDPDTGLPTTLTRRNPANTLSVTRSYTYNAFKELCRSVEPETGATLMGYDGAGNLAWSAAGLPASTACETTGTSATVAPRRVARTYNSMNRLASLAFPDGRGNQSWEYWPDGLPYKITTHNDGLGAGIVENTYAYNKRRMLTGESSTQSGWYTWGLGYAYDANGSLSTQTYPTGLAISYAPNALGQATQARDQSGYYYASGASYYPNGAIKQFTYGNGLLHSMTQNARQLPDRVTGSGLAMDFSYRYDANGNVNQIYDHVPDMIPGSSPKYRLMEYDGLDRLTAAGSAMFGGDHWHRFTYDALDNMTSWKLGGVKDYAMYVYDGKNQLASIKNTGGATIVGFGYDPQGNLNNKNGQGYTFDYGNRLRDVAGKEWYRYDGHGRRVLNWPGSGSGMLSMYSNAGQVMYQEDYKNGKNQENIYLAGSIVAIRELAHAGGVVAKYQHTDALGSPVAVTNQAGTVIERNDYEPYGTVIGKPNYQGIGYTGHVQDAATGLTYMQQRYYDPQVGRFLSVDPVTAYSNPVGMFNRYKYAANNPYRFVDPDGRQEKEDQQRERTDFRSMSSHPGAGGMAISGLPERGGAQQSSSAGRYGRSPQPTDPAWTRDPGLREQTEKAWDESNPNAAPVPKGQDGSTKKEQSGWVVQFFGSSKPELVRLGPGTRDQASRDAVNKPSEFLCNCRVLGFFHAHPNTRGEGYLPYANGYDYQFQLDVGVPGLIRSHEGYEYVPIPETKQ